jgi:hypothetical protein
MSTAQAVTKTTPRRLPALALIAALALAPVVVGSEQATASDPCAASDNYPTGSGDGSDADKAIKISSAGDLMKLSATPGDWGKYFLQDQDINMTGCTWMPIGRDSWSNAFGYFTGGYDGGNKTISNLVITGSDDLGLFGEVSEASLSNINLKNVSVTATGSNVGGLVGTALGITISDSSVDGGVVSGSASVGGLAGNLSSSGGVGSIVSKSFSTANVEGSGNWIGGLVGFASRTTIEFSYASGSVEGQERVGGLVGNTSAGPGFPVLISDSYALGTVTGAEDVGGLVGRLIGNTPNDASATATAVNSFSTGKVTGSGSRVGGFVGDAGSPSPTVGNFHGEVEASFWDTTASEKANGGGTRQDFVSLAGKPTAEMKLFDTFDAADWSIVAEFEPFDPPTTVWGICSGQNYPYLLWQFDADPCAQPVSAGAGAEPSKPSGPDASAAPGIHLDVQASVGSPVAGASVVIGGQGLQPGSAYSLVVRSNPMTVTSGVASGTGSFSQRVTLPAGIAPGNHTITLRATGSDGSALVLSQSFTVAADGTFSALGAVTGSTTGGLAVTGVNGPLGLGMMSLAALMVFVGAGLILARRRAEVVSS